MESKHLKVTVGVVGSILLGAIGSGVWEGLLAPGMSWLSGAVLSAATLGLDTIREATYADIARHTVARPSLFGPLWVLSLSVFFLGLFCAALQTMARRSKELLTKSTRLTSTEVERLQAELTSILKSRRWVYAIVGLGIFFNSFNVFQFLTLDYADAAIAHFEQSVAACGPFLSLADEKVLRARFARIASRADYIEVMDRLSAVAANNGVVLPSFRVW